MKKPMEGQPAEKAAGKSQRLVAGEELTLNRRAAFRTTCQLILDDASVTEIVVDLRDTRWIDSTGLGMLLELREIARQSGKRVALANASAGVREHLDTAHFEHLFELR